MSKRLTKTRLRDFSFSLREEGMDWCIKAHNLVNHNGQEYAAFKERGETRRRIANELDAILNGEI